MAHTKQSSLLKACFVKLLKEIGKKVLKSKKKIFKKIKKSGNFILKCLLDFVFDLESEFRE